MSRPHVNRTPAIHKGRVLSRQKVAHGKCGVTVPPVRATRDWGAVTCRKCLRTQLGVRRSTLTYWTTRNLLSRRGNLAFYFAVVMGVLDAVPPTR